MDAAASKNEVGIRKGMSLNERLSLNYTVEVQTIGGRDVEAIDIEEGSEDNSGVIAIRLHDGTKIRSPPLSSKDAARALRGEIIRRLRLDPSVAR